MIDKFLAGRWIFHAAKRPAGARSPSCRARPDNGGALQGLVVGVPISLALWFVLWALLRLGH